MCAWRTTAITSNNAGCECHRIVALGNSRSRQDSEGGDESKYLTDALSLQQYTIGSIKSTMQNSLKAIAIKQYYREL